MTILHRMADAWASAMNATPYNAPVRWWLTDDDLAGLIAPLHSLPGFRPTSFNGAIISREIFGQPSRLIMENGNSIIL